MIGRDEVSQRTDSTDKKQQQVVEQVREEVMPKAADAASRFDENSGLTATPPEFFNGSSTVESGENIPEGVGMASLGHEGQSTVPSQPLEQKPEGVAGEHLVKPSEVLKSQEWVGGKDKE